MAFLQAEPRAAPSALTAASLTLSACLVFVLAGEPDLDFRPVIEPVDSGGDDGLGCTQSLHNLDIFTVVDAQFYRSLVGNAIRAGDHHRLCAVLSSQHSTKRNLDCLRNRPAGDRRSHRRSRLVLAVPV